MAAKAVLSSFKNIDSHYTYTLPPATMKKKIMINMMRQMMMRLNLADVTITNNFSCFDDNKPNTAPNMTQSSLTTNY